MSDIHRVLVIDDSAVARRALTDILSKDDGLEVVGTAPDAMIGLRKIQELSPDVITLDIEMPGMNGFELVERVARHLDVLVGVLRQAEHELAHVEVQFSEVCTRFQRF